MPQYLFPPPAPVSVPICASTVRFPVSRLFFVGRNYLAHAAEMGHEIDKRTHRPLYFTKSHHALVASGAAIAYPPHTDSFHHEIELVVALGAPGFAVAVADAHRLIYGYAVGLDMTRRDLQQIAKQQGQPWDVAKDVENSAVLSAIAPMPGQVLTSGAITLAVNGEVRQCSDIEKLIWNIPEIIADLSTYYHLQAGDVIYTGTPAGVAALAVGDTLVGTVENVGEVKLTIAAGEC